jgi:putative DNA primase/helicase
LELCVRRAPGKRVNTTDLYLVFLAWAKASGEREWSHKGFSQAMHERGYISIQSNWMFWVDVELIKCADDFRGLNRPPCRLMSRAWLSDEAPHAAGKLPTSHDAPGLTA